MSYHSFISKLFNSRVFYMFGIFVLFIGVALENIMRTASVHINASPAEKFFLVIPVSILLLLISAFLIVMKRRWADFPAIGLLALGFLLHRPMSGFENLYENHGILRIYDLPSNYLFYLANIFLIVFLVIQIKKNKYRISLK